MYGRTQISTEKGRKPNICSDYLLGLQIGVHLKRLLCLFNSVSKLKLDFFSLYMFTIL